MCKSHDCGCGFDRGCGGHRGCGGRSGSCKNNRKSSRCYDKDVKVVERYERVYESKEHENCHKEDLGYRDFCHSGCGGW